MLAVGLSVILVVAPSQGVYGQQEPTSTPAQGNTEPPAQNPSEEPTPQSAKDIQALVAPIALYPDALVAQILSAATFPDQIALAQNWLKTNKALTGTALAQAVDKQ